MNYTMRNYGLNLGHYPPHDNIKFATLQEYTNWAKDLLERYAPQFLNSNDSIASIVNSMVIADWTYRNSVGTQEGWRTHRGFLSILSLKSCLRKDKKRQHCDILDVLVEGKAPPSTCSGEEASDMLDLLDSIDFPRNQKTFIKLKYLENQRECTIAKQFKVSKQWVNIEIQKGLKVIREEFDE